MIDFDYILTKIGGLGRFQILLISLVWFSSIPNGYISISPVFVNYIPDYRCRVSQLENCTSGWNESQILELTTPNDGGDYDVCRRFQYNNDTSQCSISCDCLKENATTLCEEGYVFDRTLFTETVVTEFNLVCDQMFLNTVATSIFMVGALAGALLSGYISDRLGRKPAAVFFLLANFCATLGCAFVHTYWLFLVCRFSMSLFSIALYIACFVYSLEITATKWRTLVGVGFQLGYAIGYMSLSGVAFYWNNWHDMMFVLSIYLAPLSLLFILIPESPRWLFAVERDEQGKLITRKMSRFNGVVLNEDTIWKEAEKACDVTIKEKQNPESEKTYSTFDLFRTSKIRIQAILTMCTWFCCGLVYFGISFNVGSLSGDIFINNVMSGVVELVAYISVILLMNKTGRKPLLIFSLTLAGVGLLCSTVVQEYADDRQSLDTLSVVFGLAGKGGIAGAYAIMYNYTSELFPTVVRSNAVAMGTTAGAIGSIITPFIIALQSNIFWLPNVIFGVVTLFTAVLAFRFPETNHIDMLENLADAELFYAGKSLQTNGNTEGKENEAFWESSKEIATATKL